MADLDLTEAIEVAARAHWNRPADRLPWESMAPSFQASVRDAVHDEVVAAAAVIEAQVRAQVADELIATRDKHIDSMPLGTSTAPADRWALTYDYAARIARGDS